MARAQQSDRMTENERTNIARNTFLFLAIGAWSFLLLSLGSFSTTDWPSHTVYPYPPTANLCGSAAGRFAGCSTCRLNGTPRDSMTA